jgi:hypothetical protein
MGAGSGPVDGENFAMNGFLELNIAEQQLWVARPDPAAWSGLSARALTLEIEAVIADLMALRAGF